VKFRSKPTPRIPICDNITMHSNYFRKYIYIIITSLALLGRFFIFLILYTVDRTPWTGDQPFARSLPTHRVNAHNIDIHALSGIRTHDSSVRASEDISCLKWPGHCVCLSILDTKCLLKFSQRLFFETYFGREARKNPSTYASTLCDFHQN
jgi:hypothetical protein